MRVREAMRVSYLLYIPYKLSGFIFLNLAITFLLICIRIISLSEVILVLTADILIIYTYFTYKLAKISVITPSMLYARESHTKDLKDFLLNWHNGFPYYIDYNIIIKNCGENLLTRNISHNWKYKDIVENHLPDECKFDFQKLHENYERLINRYDEKKSSLYEKIKIDLCEELEKNGLNTDCYINASQQSHNDFAELCFKQYTTLLGPKEKLYFNQGSRGTFAYEGSDGIALHFRPDEEGGRDPTYIVAKRNYNLRLDASGNDTRPLEKIFNDMMFGEHYLNKYKYDIDEIIQIYKELQRLDETLKNIIDILRRYPLLPGTKCYILKHLYTDSNWEDF